MWESTVTLSRRDLVRAVVVAACMGCAPRFALAGDGTYHDNMLAKLMFGSDATASKCQPFKLLCAASYLCIDQFNGDGQRFLDTLRAGDVPGLPGSVDEIDYSAGSADHRMFTHRGWDYVHQSSKVKDWATRWEIRKDILRSTVAKVFDLRDSFLFIDLGYRDPLEPLCECIYLIHIVGDHLEKKAYLLPATILPLAIANPMDSGKESDILTRLQTVGAGLFKEGRSSSGFKAGLDSHALCLRRLVGSEGGVNDEQKKAEYKEACTELEDYLCAQMPTLFKQVDCVKEAFFNTL